MHFTNQKQNLFTSFFILIVINFPSFFVKFLDLGGNKENIKKYINLVGSHLFFPSKSAIQKFEPKASTWSSLARPAGAIKRLGQLSWYNEPAGVLCR